MFNSVLRSWPVKRRVLRIAHLRPYYGYKKTLHYARLAGHSRLSMLYTNLVGLSGPALKVVPRRIGHGAPCFQLPHYTVQAGWVSILFCTRHWAKSKRQNVKCDPQINSVLSVRSVRSVASVIQSNNILRAL